MRPDLHAGYPRHGSPAVPVPALPRPAGDERGMSVSTLFAAVMPAFILAAGLAVDGAARLTAQREAQAAAAAAARAATDSAAAARLQGAAGDAQAIAAADAVAREYDIVDVSVSIGPDRRVRVRTTADCDTVFLGLIGINGFTVTGLAEAELRRS